MVDIKEDYELVPSNDEVEKLQDAAADSEVDGKSRQETVEDTEEATLNPPNASPYKRAVLIAIISFLLWFMYGSRKKEPKIIYASRCVRLNSG